MKLAVKIKFREYMLLQSSGWCVSHLLSVKVKIKI